MLYLCDGIKLEAKREIFIDSLKVKNKEIIVTHAHSDHARVKNNNNYYLTEQTAYFVSNSIRDNFNLVGLDKKLCFGDVSLSFYNSGHIPGAIQVMVENSNSIAITSDFKLQESLITKPADILSSDILVIESTYGLPNYEFKDREEIYNDMAKWAKDMLADNNFVILGGYSIGKAQELTKFCNEYLSCAPLVYKTIFEKNRLIEKVGFSLGDYILLDNNFSDSNVAILPINLIDNSLVEALSHQIKKKISVALATGQPVKRYKRFELSDHADFKQLLHYVKESSPKLVFTYHGHSEILAKYIRKKLSINAFPLTKKQKVLANFFGFF
ncbi:MAG: MBL fold metallo-hydrolase [Candidatus Diapherotrites archaeon]|nr:MBL fold metallo-hydrolase [Candidatus Diapherotrites archaeon]